MALRFDAVVRQLIDVHEEAVPGTFLDVTRAVVS
ncbi:hypothetical protein HDA41_006029 [Streptomyces caelestis]|jgi:hypothetical protein|uniref:Uncharacterized protein n=1 Tax=Streptomyces caelestis TaxID=36816 RepID=A0A7W9H9B5_9ACTN|nr:hypothetical protein [Streptomyces caelestis]